MHHAHELLEVDVVEGNSVFVEVEKNSDGIVSLYGIGPAFLHNGQNMLEEMLPRLHRLLLRDRGLCGIRLRASEDLESPTGELHHCLVIFVEAETGDRTSVV